MSERPVCVVCHRPQDTYDACGRCVADIRRRLEELLDLYHKAAAEMLPGSGGHGAAGSEQSIGLNVAALNWRTGHDILNVLHEWERIIREDRHLTPPALVPLADPGPEGDWTMAQLVAAVRFQQSHLDWSGTQPWFDDYAREVRDLHGQGQAAAREHRQRAMRVPCPAETDHGHSCGKPLAIPDDLTAPLRCPACRSEWTVARLIVVALSDPNVTIWADADAIGTYLNITGKQVRRVARTHQIRKRGMLYDLGAFLNLRQQVA